MSSIVCLVHPKYDGGEAPDLSCRACCKIYVDNIVANQTAIRESKSFDTNKWLEEKTKRQNNDQKNIGFFI